MEDSLGKRWHRFCYFAATLIFVFLAGLMSHPANAQQATATVSGVVKDPTGAAIPGAKVELTNVETGVVRTSASNGDGVYEFPSVTPGSYSMRASASGFTAVSQPPVTLQVDQIATFDFQLKVGATQSSVTVNATAPALQTSTSQLGTVVTANEVNSLPLNGRNFTELLTLTAGVANVNTDQNKGGGVGFNGKTIGDAVIPSINGAGNPMEPATAAICSRSMGRMT